MLYRRWLELLARFAGRPAIFQGAGSLTFTDLADALGQKPTAEGPVRARSGSVDIFVEVLRAWRDGQVLVLSERDADFPLLGGMPKSTSLVKYTAGGSGIPRGIFFNEAQVAADVDRLVGVLELRAGVPNLGVISLVHSYGFSSVVLPLLLHGVPVHLVEVPFPRAIDEAFKMHPAIYVAAVPSMWRAWLRAGILVGAPIRCALSAGAPLALELETQVMAAAGLKIRNFYGASECGGISLDLAEKVRESAEDVGEPLPGVQLSFSEDKRIIVQSASVAMGYEFSHDDEWLGAGIYQTRDFGMMGAGERLYLTGTSGAAINVAGRKISPSTLEAAIASTGLVRQIKIYGIPSSDAERCEEIVARVELRPGATLEEVKCHSMKVLQCWERPRHWRVMT